MRSPGLATLVAASALAVSGCTLAPRYQRPAAPVAAEFPAGAGAATGPAASDLGWRDVFQDPGLQAVIDQALRENRDLRVAALNVELARAQYGIQRSYLLPTVGATGSGSRARTAKDLSFTGEPSVGNTFSAGVGLTSFEIDLFGRVRSLRNQALEQYLSTEEAHRSAHLALVSEVAVQYLASRALQSQVALAEQTLQTVQQSYDLAKRTFEAGRTSELDFRTAEAQVETARVNLSAYQQQLAQAENALVLLAGGPLPKDLPTAPLESQPPVAELPAGLPSDLLQRRPDILSAEHQLKAANASIGAARAAFFPSISLTASVGTASTELSNLFTAGSGTWAFSPRIDLPIFTGGRNKANLDAANVRKQIEIASYEKAIQVAFREVADALVARGRLDEQLEAQTRRVQAEQRRYDISELRYRKGVDSYLNVLTAQRDLYGAQQQLIQTRLTRFSNSIGLYRALGGGWLEHGKS
ncbi:RND efflux system, outer membrane lipoprotein, NodT family [Anaeromyxobacter dehalogenans 2CP-1]|uniref:RND efflux system, outer membrane lipoprotein, NodT family n=1 Tax=Anaeromyxobacter dehalogenans (strain ATCC BAA-258 / DSM 21875 / 2CP-1) TaxID=455488 RepID=B8JBY0_ANAD2|nr:AdeC/AdeK/OprM family multidrug efflux complex outer membrane factor [Anaeromyxobacter dehalogenans]ACL63902.1 RND efflux system, outer membrane lipoprotein, NodT family [Anaeromyxobacter dehalogenans 2CP-1]